MPFLIEDQRSLVRRAMGQTYRAGHQYMRMPYPWWEEFCMVAGQAGEDTGIPWGNLCCGHGERYSGDGEDIFLCLKELMHDGPCGWDRGVTEP